MLGKAGAWQGGRQGLVFVVIFGCTGSSLLLSLLSRGEQGLVIAVAYFVAKQRLWACRLSR